MYIRGFKIFLLLFLCITLTGCFWEKPTIIKFSTWGSASELNILKPIIAEFEKENPSVKIELMHIPQDYFKKLHLLFASNLTPDVVFINNLNLPLYKDFLLELNEEFKSDEYYSQPIEAMTIQDKIYAIPRDVSTLVIYYNKALFNKYEVNYPTKSWTMVDLVFYASALSQNGNWGIGLEPGIYYALPFMRYFGGGIFDKNGKYIADTKESEKSIKFYRELSNKYHIAPTAPQIGSKTLAQMFLEGKIAMHLSGRWLVPKYRECAKFDWDVVNFPKCSSPSDTSGWAVSKSSKHKKLAIKFVLFLSSKENIAKMCEDGLIVPARKDVALSEDFLGGKPEHSDIFLYALENSTPTNVTTKYNKTVDILTDKYFK